MPKDQTNDRHEDVIDEGGDDDTERRTDDDTDGEVDDVAPKGEVTKFLEHGDP